MIQAIKKFLADQGFNKRRQMFIALSTSYCGDQATAHENFLEIRVRLSAVMEKYIAGQIKNPYSGICGNAGFFDCPIRLSNLFLQMCRVFNREIRGIESSYRSSWPFIDVDCGADSKWKGEPGEVRANCMAWILYQIQHYRLD